MPGFVFRYRVSGRPATILSFVFNNTETLSRGDMLNLEDGKVVLGATGDTAIVGAAVESLDGEAGTTTIRVIVDADAVYGVEDRPPRTRGSTLDLRGLTGAQGLGASLNAEFVVDVSSAADEETLVRINGERHFEQAPAEEHSDHLTGGMLDAAIARAVVRHHREHLGRGPTKAQAFHRDDILVVVLQDTMTPAERSLVDGARSEAVLSTRQVFQDIMGPYLRSTVERLTGCTVLAFMSANHVDPDIATELFVLDGPIPARPEQ